MASVVEIFAGLAGVRPLRAPSAPAFALAQGDNTTRWIAIRRQVLETPRSFEPNLFTDRLQYSAVIKRLLKSVFVGAVVALVVVLTWQMLAAVYAGWRYHSAIAVQAFHPITLRTGIALFICIFVFAASFCRWLLGRNRLLPTPLLASLFGFAIVGSVALAVLSSLSRQPQAIPSPIWSLIAFFASCFAVVGFYGGLFGGAWLKLRFKHIRSVRRLLLESAMAGTILGALFTLTLVPPSAYRARSDVSPHELLLLSPLLVCASAGCLISVAFALTFHRRLIASRS